MPGQEYAPQSYGGGEEDDFDQEDGGQVNKFEHTLEVDDLLDDIDDVLEENAQEFVDQYVQKGGQ